jgi:excisionase family DNA binding protein
VDTSRDYFTTQELALHSGLSLSTVNRRAQDGSIPSIQPGGPRSRRLFRRDVLDALEKRAAEPIPQQPPARQDTSSSSAAPEGPDRLPGRRPRWKRLVRSDDTPR